MWIAVCLNALLATFVFWLALCLWRWRCALLCFVYQLERSAEDLSAAPQQARYSLTYKRVQMAQTKLKLVRTLALWQRRSHQLKQTQRLLRLLRLIVISRRLG